MPIYEYRCRECSHEFELLVRGSMTPACPPCGSAELDRLISLPRVHSDARRERSLAAAKKRDAKLGSERTRAQREYELSHND
ncbi:MAG: zinc ribbon domain-containing protein [Gemmatimonadota bacterium]|uniref:FmdB family zinc ribbon protein n=1 Tax=Candidatus Palauibacter scopulicola TaxID=3056741 RepID=UPI0023827981|nr:zinc ribbon domain-containing protein [Candidatus Palauibacter scopulicola]MDE2661701.1 zinc ribbon domain-containing protein [Candidatus Palauibacter scopulicola]